MKKYLTKQLCESIYQDNKEDNKYIFLCEYVFNLTTYDDDLATQWGEVIYEVLCAIRYNKSLEYFHESEIQEPNYQKFLLVCQLLEIYKWIDWGTSIRFPWFSPEDNSRKLFVNEDIAFTIDNIQILLDWIKE